MGCGVRRLEGVREEFELGIDTAGSETLLTTLL
jgi:hypothetical protein